MKLDEFKRSREGDTARYVLPVADTTGPEDYELVLAGPEKAVRRLFAESDFQIEVDPRRFTRLYGALQIIGFTAGVGTFTYRGFT